MECVKKQKKIFFKSEVTILSYEAKSLCSLQEVGDEVQYIGERQCFSMCDVCLLCEDVYYFREYSYRENHFLKQEFLLMLFVGFFLYLLLPPPSLFPLPLCYKALSRYLNLTFFFFSFTCNVL